MLGIVFIHGVEFAVFALQLLAHPFVIFDIPTLTEGVELGQPLAHNLFGLAAK